MDYRQKQEDDEDDYVEEKWIKTKRWVRGDETQDGVDAWFVSSAVLDSSAAKR